MSGSACIRCNGALAPGAQFCGACGAAQSAPPNAPQAAPQAPAYPSAPPMPMAPPMPQMPQMARGFSGGGGGQTRQETFFGAPHDAFNQATRAIAAAGGELHWQHPPQSAKFLLVRKGFWSTGGIAVKYDGELQVQPSGPGQTTARFSLKVQWGSTLLLFAIQIASVFFASMFSYYVAAFGLFLLIGGVIITAWNVSTNEPKRALDAIIKALQSGAPAPQMAPAPQHYAPQPYAPAPQAPAAPTPAQMQQAPQPAPPAQAAPNDAALIMEQIKQLGALRDAGALTPEEFDAKKAELLKRI